MRAIAVVCLAACTIPLVSTQRAHIDTFHRTVGRNHSVYYQKLGVPLEGTTCGDEYMHAVAGVPQAEALMSRCYRDNLIYGAGMLGFVAFPVAGIVTGLETGGSTSTAALATGIGLGAASFLIGSIAGIYSGYRMRDSVEAYNLAVDTGIEQR